MIKKIEAVVSFCTRDVSADEVAEDLGVSRSALYTWKKRYLTDQGKVRNMTSKKRSNTSNNKSIKEENSQLLLEKEEPELKLERLQNEVYKLRIEKDLLEKAAELLKKDKGINLLNLKNKDKAILINALREYYPLNDLLLILSMAKSSYFYQVVVLKKEDKYRDLKITIKSIFDNSYQSYGYRRLHHSLLNEGIKISEKVVRKIMKLENLVVKGRKKSKYNSYKGDISPEADNLLKRDFKTDEPNKKWLTDITELHIPARKVYLSPMLDCFDGLITSWSISDVPNAELTNSMLDAALEGLNETEKPLIHTDQGSHYRWPGWISRMKEAGLTRSMSRKGCPQDNAACEGFFGRLKNEMFYGRNWKGVSMESFINQLNDYINWYNNERVKLSLGGLSPIMYRRTLGLCA